MRRGKIPTLVPSRKRIAGRIKRVRVVGPSAARAYRALQKYRSSAASVTRRNSRQAYEKLFRSDRLWAQYLSTDRMRFYEEVAAISAELDPRSVIDVGCGSGELIRAIASRLPGQRAFAGVDHARHAIARARAAFPEATWIVADLYGLEPDALFGGRRFDLVLCTEVLEHLADSEGALDVLATLTAPGGRVLVTVPDGAVDVWGGHVNFWSEEELARLLAPRGLDEIRRIDEGRTLLAIVSPRS